MNTQLDIVKHQEKAYGALLEIDRILRKYGIQYYLLAGSVLGAVRHGGFIPWDDDIDIGIKNEDYEKAAYVIQEELDKQYSWIDKEHSPAYPRLYGKILYDSIGCVDVFKLVKTSNNPRGRLNQWRRRKLLFKLYKAKVGYAHANEICDTRKKLKVAAAKQISRFFSLKWICRMIKNNENRFSNEANNEYYLNLYSIYSLEKELIHSSWLDSPSEVRFNGKNIYTVGNTEDYLTHLYGDYMELPPVEKRKVRHMEEY